jgi:hypothetical protein
MTLDERIASLIVAAFAVAVIALPVVVEGSRLAAFDRISPQSSHELSSLGRLRR